MMLGVGAIAFSSHWPGSKRAGKKAAIRESDRYSVPRILSKPAWTAANSRAN